MLCNFRSSFLISCNVCVIFFFVIFFSFFCSSDNSCIYMVVKGFGVVLLKLDLVNAICDILRYGFLLFKICVITCWTLQGGRQASRVAIEVCYVAPGLLRSGRPRWRNRQSKLKNCPTCHCRWRWIWGSGC